MKILRPLKYEPITREDIGRTVYNKNRASFVVKKIEDACFGFFGTERVRDGLMLLEHTDKNGKVETVHCAVNSEEMYRSKPIVISEEDFLKGGGVR